MRGKGFEVILKKGKKKGKKKRKKEKKRQSSVLQKEAFGCTSGIVPDDVNMDG